jgi:molybdopterin/thiamine biosynthesis adenylyltransferase
MTRSWIGKSRIESIKKRLNDLNPDVDIIAVGENISDANVDHAVSLADIVVDGAPLFEERFAMNRAAVSQGKPMVECAMFSLEGQVTTIVPGKTACLRCLYPQVPGAWKRQFPVFGAVSGIAACLGAMEVIKVLSGIGEPLCNTLLQFELATMGFRKIQIRRNPECEVCGETEC